MNIIYSDSAFTMITYIENEDNLLDLDTVNKLMAPDGLISASTKDVVLSGAASKMTTALY